MDKHEGSVTAHATHKWITLWRIFKSTVILLSIEYDYGYGSVTQCYNSKKNQKQTLSQPFSPILKGQIATLHLTPYVLKQTTFGLLLLRAVF